RDDVLANRLHVRCFFDGKAIGKLHQHFGTAGFWRVNRSREPIDRWRVTNDSRALSCRESARISQLSEVRLDGIETSEVRFIANGSDNHLTALIAQSKREHLHARRRACELTEVAIDVGDV